MADQGSATLRQNAGMLGFGQIAAATGLSAARVHQLLSSTDAQQIPRWLSRLREDQGEGEKEREKEKEKEKEEEGEAKPEETSELSLPDEQFLSPLEAELQAEVAVIRRCIGWLEQLERGEMVAVNMRLETDSETENVRFDGERVRRILGRIAADVEKLVSGRRKESTQPPTNISDLKANRHNSNHRKRTHSQGIATDWRNQLPRNGNSVPKKNGRL